MAKKNIKTENAQDQVNTKVTTTKNKKVDVSNVIIKNAEPRKKMEKKVADITPEPQKKNTKNKEKELKKEANIIKKAIMKSHVPKAKENLEFTVLPKEEPKKKSRTKKAEPASNVEVKPEPKKATKAKKAEPASNVEVKPEPKKATKAKKAEPASDVEVKPEPKKATKAKKAEPASNVEVKPEPKKATKAKKAEPVAVEESKPEPIGVAQARTQSKKVKVELQEDQEKPQVAAKPNVRYSDEELEMFKNVIIEAKREAADELRMLKERLDDLNSYDLAEESMIYSMHMGEQGSEPMEKEKTYAQIQRINEYIKKLDDALDRIKDKTYGICRVCGILIAKERLLAVPITTLSASWKIHNRCPDDGVDKIVAVK